MDVSASVHNLPTGVRATMDEMTLTIGDMRIDLRTLFHETRAFDKLHKFTFPAHHPRYPLLDLLLSTRDHMYVGVSKNDKGLYTAVDASKRLIGVYETVGEAAIRRALLLRKRRHESTKMEGVNDDTLA
jgi:hypothetical protein